MGDGGGRSAVDAYIDELRHGRRDGFHLIWTAQLPWEPDLLVLLGVALREVGGVTVGSGVLPIQPRHPMVMAQEALTLSLISGGRFRLGVGLTHEAVSDGMWGISWARNVRCMREFLDGLLPLLQGRPADAPGELVTTRGHLAAPGSPPPKVYLAALGPQLLRLAGRLADGTITWMAGPKTLAGHVVPTIRAAAEAAGRDGPEVIAGFPVCVADDPDGARRLARETFALYGALPSYRAMLDREGISDPGDIAVVGDEAAVGAGLEELAAAGVTEFGASVLPLDPESVPRTRELLRSIGAH
jgi:F420-dependent oxidoreductase-like protein